MKINGLAIIFVIIILPIALIIGEYANAQIETFEMEQLYDSRLIDATYDALKAFQINTFNDATSDMADSKINSIEASANAFYNSMEMSFGIEGYSREALQMYVPALVYTMYDGYYIYSPYTNVTEITDGDTETGEGKELNINLDSSNIEYGFKPYVYYSCHYKMGRDSDFIINYSLDNYITVQGTVNGKIVYKSGYLLTIDKAEGLRKLRNSEGTFTYVYNGQKILAETSLSDYLVESDGTQNEYKYIKLNGTKYYLNDKDDDGDGEIDEYIFYIMGGDRIKQVSKKQNEQLYSSYKSQIENNTSAINYYKSAYEFTTWVNNNLDELTLGDAITEVQYSGNEDDKIFDNEYIEYSGSNFNLHRKEVIRYSIESNLAVAIANFNNYTNVDPSTNFQMPKLKETDWEMLENEVSIISFLQGLNIGGKIYNGYTVVTNDKTEEVVKEERIYMTTADGYYHKINDKHFQDDTDNPYETASVNRGILDLDFEIRKDAATGISYINKAGLGCYISVVGQENVDNTYDSIYEYLIKTDIDDEIKQKYYIALGRERWGTYKVESPSTIVAILNNMEPEEIIGADDITPDDYGAYVTNYTSPNGASVNWRIFHSDGTNIYLIAENFIERTYVPTGKNGTTGTAHTSLYKAFSLTSAVDYTGAIDIKNNSLANKWLSKYTFYTVTNGIKGTAYLMDTNQWSGFANSSYADYAIGAPTLELFAASYNATHETDINVRANSSTGYTIKWSNGTTWTGATLTGLDKSETLYVTSDTGASSAWMASPNGGSSSCLWGIGSTGTLHQVGYNNTNYGSRPIICLKSSTELEKQDDGTYLIIEPGSSIEDNEGNEEQEPETTISVSIMNYDGIDTYTIKGTETAQLTKAISYTLPTIDHTEYKVKYAFVSKAETESIDYIWDDDSVEWQECGASGNIYTKEVSEEGIWYLLAKVENTATGERVAYAMQPYTVEREIVDTTAPEIIIENQDGIEDGNYVIASGYISTNISEKITVNNEESGTNLNADSFLYIFTQEASQPDETAEWQNYGGTGAIVTKEISEAGTWYLYVKAADIEGNEKVETRTYTITKESAEVTYDIQITDALGDTDTKVYDIPTNSSITMRKKISVTASDGNTENLTIQYKILTRTQTATTWTTYTPGSIISKTVSYSAYGYYYLQVQVLDADGNVVVEKEQQYIFNGAYAIV